MSPPDSIPVLQMLVRLTNARRVVEVGVFTGCVTKQPPPHCLLTSAVFVASCTAFGSQRRLRFAGDTMFVTLAHGSKYLAYFKHVCNCWSCRYTALGMALALPPGGKLIACDITDEYPAIGALHGADYPGLLPRCLSGACTRSCPELALMRWTAAAQGSRFGNGQVLPIRLICALRRPPTLWQTS